MPLFAFEDTAPIESAGWWVKLNPTIYRELAARHRDGVRAL
jgi:hypothetical protein